MQEDSNIAQAQLNDFPLPLQQFLVLKYLIGESYDLYRLNESVATYHILFG